MEMIGDKVSRLTPDQQREVEDFIDFLITRDSNATQSTRTFEGGDNFPGVRDDVPKTAPVIFADEHPGPGRNDQDILPDYPEYGGAGITRKTREPERKVVISRRTDKEPGGLLDWID